MKLEFFFWKINFCCFCFWNRKYFIYLKNEIGTHKKKSLSSFQRKSGKSIPSKLPGKRGESQLDCLSTKSFLARVVLSPLSPIFLKK